MAEIFNNRICVFANELIIFNPKTQVGSEDGFIPEGTYYSMVRETDNLSYSAVVFPDVLP